MPWPPASTPLAVVEAAVAALDSDAAITVRRRSRWFRSPPYPPSLQPWFVNGVIEVVTRLSSAALMQRLHAVEARFGRRRGVPNAARTLDLDLLAYGDLVSSPSAALVVPHPRMHERAFVLAPLCDIAPDWCHPRLHRSAAELLAALPFCRGTCDDRPCRRTRPRCCHHLRKRRENGRKSPRFFQG